LQNCCILTEPYESDTQVKENIVPRQGHQCDRNDVKLLIFIRSLVTAFFSARHDFLVHWGRN